MGKLIHERAISACTDIWRLEEGATISCASVEEPVKELGVNGPAEHGPLVGSVILSRLAVEAFQGESSLQCAWQFGMRQRLCQCCEPLRIAFANVTPSRWFHVKTSFDS
jgi:hypothetical protein